MGDAEDQHQNALGVDRINDHVVLAGMDATKSAMPFEFRRSLPARIIGQQVDPAGDPLLDMAGQRVELFLGPRRQRDCVSHGSEPQLLLDLLPRDRPLPRPLELLERLAALLRPIAIFEHFQ